MTPTLQLILGILAVAATCELIFGLSVILVDRAQAAEAKRREGATK